MPRYRSRRKNGPLAMLMGCGFLVVLALAGCGGLMAIITGNIRPGSTHTHPSTPTTTKPTGSDHDLPEDYDHNHPENPRTIFTPADNGRVHVKGYYRKDGTYVRPHTRSK